MFVEVEVDKHAPEEEAGPGLPGFISRLVLGDDLLPLLSLLIS